MRRLNCTKLGEDIGRSSLRYKFVAKFGYLAVFSNAGGSMLSNVENDATCRTFCTPVKIRGGVGEISGSINEVLATTEPPEYI